MCYPSDGRLRQLARPHTLRHPTHTQTNKPTNQQTNKPTNQQTNKPTNRKPQTKSKTKNTEMIVQSLPMNIDPLPVYDFADMDIPSLSDCEFLDETFDLNFKEDTEKLLGMDEASFHRMIDEDKRNQHVTECMEDIIRNIEAMQPLKRTPSLQPLVPRTQGKVISLELPNDPDVLTRPADTTVFDSESEMESEPESEVESEAETDVQESEEESVEESEPEVQNLREEVELLESQVELHQSEVEQRDMALVEKQNELERLKHQHRVERERMQQRLDRKRQLDDSESYRPVKRSRVERRGCPFCPFEQTTSGYDMRCLKDHMTNGDCECPINEMTFRSCTHTNVWCEEGESGWQCLKNMGFKDPDNHVSEFRHFTCPKCDFTHWHARKFKRHLQAGVNRGGCAFSKEEAEEIKNDQLRRKNMVRL
jgi:hypothetical protein